MNSRPLFAACAALWLVSTAAAQDVINPQTNATALTTGTLPAARMPALTGDVTTSAGAVATSIAANAVTLAKLATQATNTVLGNATSGTAVPTALAVGTCSTSSSAVIWTTNTGFGCNTSINAATLGSATFAAPGAIGGGTASTGAFTTISATSNVSASGNITGGQSSGSNLMLINGGVTNSGDGALFVLRNNGSNILLIGNKSAIDSGAYSATSGLWSANSWNWYVNGSTTASMSLSTTGVLAMVATVDATSTTTGTITNPGGMSVNKRVWMDGLSTATGTPSSICRNANEITVNATTSCIVSSLIFKHDFEPLQQSGLATVMKMRPGSFYYNDGGDRQRFGFAAEYMRDLDPRLADAFDPDGNPRSIDQTAILAVTVKGLQELASEVRELRAR